MLHVCLYLQSQVEHISTEGLRELVRQVCERDSSLILDVVDLTSQGERSRACVVRCREMPFEEERECCRQTPENCISLQPVATPF